MIFQKMSSIVARFHMKLCICLGIFLEYDMFVDMKERYYALFAYDIVVATYNFLYFI